MRCDRIRKGLRCVLKKGHRGRHFNGATTEGVASGPGKAW
jgi:hypothetical protein